MIVIAVDGCTMSIPIGRRGENNARQIVFDLTHYIDTYGSGTAQLLHQRRGDETPYIPAQVEQRGEQLLWTLNSDDTGVAGTGRAELRWYVGDTLAKSVTYSTSTARSMANPEGEPETAKGALEILAEEVAGMNRRVPPGGTTGQVLTKASNADYDNEWTDPEGGGGGTSDYDDLQNRPSINGVTLTGNQTAENLGLATPNQIPTDNAQLENGAGYVTADTAPVRTVNGKTGAVVLTAEDVNALPDNSTLDDIPDGATYKRATGQQLGQIATNAGNISGIEEKIPNQASADNQLADQAFVNSSINSAAAFFRGAFPTYAALMEVQWQTSDPTAENYVSNNDYAYVADDETHNDEAWRYIYVLQPGGADNGWAAQFRVNESPLTAAQVAALNSGATAALIEQISTNAAAIALKQAIINATGLLKGNGNGEVVAAVEGTDYATPAQVNAKYSKPSSGIPKSDLSADVQTALGAVQDVQVNGASIVTDGVANVPVAGGDTYGVIQIGLGISGASVGEVATVSAVDSNGKPTAWSATAVRHTLTVTALTQDGVTVTGQTVTVRVGGAEGDVFATAAYNGQPVSFALPVGMTYYASISDTLASHFNPTTASGVVTDSDIAVSLTYSDFSNIRTAGDIKAALNGDIDLTDLVGEQITCSKGDGVLTWDVVDYDADEKSVTLLLHDTLPDNMVFEPAQALAYFENGLAAGNYSFKQGNATYYFTLTSAIPAGGQLRATATSFNTYASQDATATTETGTVSTTEIAGATSLGTAGSNAGTYPLNHMDRVNYGSNNFGESGLFQWLNSTAPANTKLPRINKFSRPYSVNVAGLLNGLDADFLAAVGETAWKCSANNVYEAPASMGGITQARAVYTVNAKIGLASQREIFGSYDGVDAGDAIFDLYVGAGDADRIKYYNSSARHWWLRSPTPNAAGNERNVHTSGAVDGNNTRYSLGVSPACKIYKSAESAPVGA